MKFSHKWHKGHLSGFTAETLRWTAAAAGLEAIECGEIGDGGNLFGVFRRAQPLSGEEIRTRLAGCHSRTLASLAANSDADYFCRPDTWTKIPRKLITQIEERMTAPKHLGAPAILESVYRGV
jgi:hypothetical protein